jgi:hypothetical protein
MMIIGVGRAYQEGRRMAGIEDIVQGLEIELHKKISAQQELSQRQSELVLDIDTLTVMIQAGRERMNGHVAPQERVVPANPFPEHGLAWFCFDVLKDAKGPMNYKAVYAEVVKRHHCTESNVYDVMYEDTTHFTLEGGGFFTVAGL